MTYEEEYEQRKKIRAIAVAFGWTEAECKKYWEESEDNARQSSVAVQDALKTIRGKSQSGKPFLLVV